MLWGTGAITAGSVGLCLCHSVLPGSLPRRETFSSYPKSQLKHLHGGTCPLSPACSWQGHWPQAGSASLGRCPHRGPASCRSPRLPDGFTQCLLLWPGACFPCGRVDLEPSTVLTHRLGLLLCSCSDAIIPQNLPGPYTCIYIHTHIILELPLLQLAEGKTSQTRIPDLQDPPWSIRAAACKQFITDGDAKG